MNWIVMILLVQLCEMQRIQRSHSFWVPHRSNPSNQHSLPLSSLFLLRVPLLDRSQFRSALWKGRSWIIWWNDSMILWTTYFDCFPIFFDLHGVSLILYTGIWLTSREDIFSKWTSTALFWTMCIWGGFQWMVLGIIKTKVVISVYEASCTRDSSFHPQHRLLQFYFLLL